MTISRRSFARSILAAVAGAAVLRQAVAAPLKEQIAEVFGVPVESVPEGPRAIADREVAVAWKAYRIGARRITVTCSVSRELLEEHPCSMSMLVQDRLARAMAKKIDEEWGKGVGCNVSTIWDEDPAKPEVTCTQIATECGSYGLLRAEWLRRRALGEWDSTPTLPEGWEMRQYGPYLAADGWPAVEPKDWHLIARGPIRLRA